MKKILILGGKPIGSCEITEAARKRGLYTIVADYLNPDESAAKKIADEHWEVSTADIDTLKRRCLEEGVSAVVTGVNEFNIERKIELCNELSLSQYCTKSQWFCCENKAEFKKLCARHGIPVAGTYNAGSENIRYPVIVKPVDGSGSRGFSICRSKEELERGIRTAKAFSASGACLVEEYIQCEACIIHYTAVNGRIYFSGMSDKHSQVLEGGASVMALQTFPSESMGRYLNDMNQKAVAMLEDMEIKDGPLWIEAFNDKGTGRFIFNEIGYRFGGSMTNYPVEFFYGIDQLSLMISNALGEETDMPDIEGYFPRMSHYCILPVHLRKGTITSIYGLENTERIFGVEKIVLVHHIGDRILNWGTAQQVFCYAHFSYNTGKELAERIGKLKKNLSVRDENGNEMLFFLFDLNRLGVRENTPAIDGSAGQIKKDRL